MTWTSSILETYAAARAAVHRLQEERRRAGAIPPPVDVEELARRIASGALGLGDRVSVEGHLSRAVNWYLPSGYSPYRFHTDYAVKGYNGALRLYPMPSLLPAGEIPFRHPTLSLGFLYPTGSQRLAIQLGVPRQEDEDATVRIPRTADDQAWFMNLEGSANYSSAPLEFISFMGSNQMQNLLPNEPVNNLRVLPDPSRLRDLLQVPSDSLCFPVVYERGSAPTGVSLRLAGTIGELDQEAIGALSRLGSPLSNRAFGLFYRPEQGLPPLCLRVDSFERIEVTSGDQQRPLYPFSTEFCLQNPEGERIGFGDDELVEVFLPSVKDFVYPVEGILLPDRWVGKVYGFDGPVYLYKTGPFEVAISLAGMYFVTALPSSQFPYSELYRSFEQFVSILKRRLEQSFQEKAGIKAVAKTTYLTERGWQIGMGRLLEGIGEGDARRYFGASASTIGDEAAEALSDQEKPTVSPDKEEVTLQKCPKAFISYTWESEPHKKWVKELGARLRKDGVTVTLDQWDIRLGDQLPHFMEKSIRENDFVLIVCTPLYKQKSDGRLGGVGYEGDVITGEIAVDGDQRKFIPVLRNGDWKDASPSWLRGKMYVNLEGDPYSEAEYGKLIQNLHGHREDPPPVGSPPNFN